MNIKEKIGNTINRYKLKQDILVAKGMLAEIYVKADWNDNNLTTEDQLRADRLKAEIIKAEYILNRK